MARGVTPNILVTDGRERASLAVVRSLGAAGYLVHVCSDHEPSLAGASRYAEDAAQVEDPLGEPGAYVSSISGLIDQWGIEIVVPVADASLIALLDEQERLGPAQLLAPPEESYRNISDKARVTEMAETVGIDVPRQVLLSNQAELDAAAETLQYPIVVKPSRSVAEGAAKLRELGVGYAEGREELEMELDRIPRGGFPVLLQQRIKGAGVGVFLLRWDEEILARFCHRRIREKPPSGGVSVYRMSVAPNERLVDQSARLLAAHDWRGVAMVEYKVERNSGTPYLMEVNGRFWGSLQLAIDAGVDFPRLLMEAFSGRTPEPVMDYQTGVRSRWWWGEVDHLIARLARSREALKLSEDDPSLAGTLAGVLTPWRPGDKSEVLRWSDPRPFLVETRSWLANSLRSADG